MKTIIIISSILLMTITAFAQPNPRERQRMRDPGSEASARRKTENTKSEAAARHRAVNPSREENHSKAMNRTSQRFTDREVYKPRQARTVVNRTESPEHRRSKGQKNNSANVRPVKQTAGKTHATVTNRGDHGKRNAYHRRSYVTPNRKNVRKTGTRIKHVPARYRAVNNHYRAPKHVHVTWSNRMYREYITLYPDFHYWYYPAGYRIVTIPTYKAYFHIGEVRNVYGRIHAVWYSWQTDEYYLYFGGIYPYHDFTVILPGRQARRFNRHPEAFFHGRHIWVTGLVSTYEGKPEIMVMRKHQVHLY